MEKMLWPYMVVAIVSVLILIIIKIRRSSVRQVVAFITVEDLCDIHSVQKNIGLFIKKLDGKKLIEGDFDQNITWKGIRLDKYIVISFASIDDCKEFAEGFLQAIPGIEHVCCFLSRRQYAVMTHIFRFLNRLLYRPLPDLIIDEGKIVNDIQKEKGLWFSPETLDISLKQNLDAPMCIVTFNQFREMAEYEDDAFKVVSGYSAYKVRYANAVLMSALKHGMHPVYLSEDLTLLFATPNHPLNQKWEDLQINEYLSRRDFFQLIQDDHYQNASVHRRAAVTASFVQCSTLHHD